MYKFQTINISKHIFITITSYFWALGNKVYYICSSFSVENISDIYDLLLIKFHFHLPGQMFNIHEKYFLFICSPRLFTLDDVTQMNLYISDIPLYDVTRELVIVNQQRMAEMEIRWVQGQLTEGGLAKESVYFCELVYSFEAQLRGYNKILK